MKIIDLFAGPGGWDQGLVDMGFGGTVVGLEWDAAACDTAMAAGHLRVQADVAQYPPPPFAGYDGLIASPPCQAFSLAGKGAGLGVTDKLLDHVWACKDGWVDPPSDICTDDVRADLTLQPLRWADAIRPDWIALEQVPGVLPLWRAMAAVFERWGYSTAVAKLNAADYGVPQTRQRAILVASRTVPAQMPEPTHFDPRKGVSLFGEPWVSMSDGLSWPDGGTVRTGANSMKHSRNTEDIVPYERSTDEPAPTVDAKAGSAWKVGWSVPDWAHGRPSTTVCADPRIGRPGHKDRSPGGESQFENDSVRVTASEAGVLQSFPRDYPWQGSKAKQHEQVGNAIPPRLAAVVLGPLVRKRAAAA